jgi:hypothetical protein
MAGQAIACPHCNETFFLPKPKSNLPWIMAAAFALVTVCLGSLLIFQHKKSKSGPETHTFSKPTAAAIEPTKTQNDIVASKTADDETIEKICRKFYEALSAQDGKSIYELLPEPCKKALKVQDIFIDGAKYEFEDLESVKYKNGGYGQSAMATVKRRFEDRYGTHDGLRDLKFVKESGSWKFFPATDIAKKIVNEFTKSGLNDQVNADIQLLRDGDPFVVLDTNNTNAFEAIYKFDQGQVAVFPWDVEFAVTSNKIDGMMLILNYSIRNKSSTAWVSPLLDFRLKQGGKIVLTGNDLLPNVQPDQQLERSTTLFLAGEPQETLKYDLDVSSSGGFDKSIPLIQNIPLEFKVHAVLELAKLEVLSTQFDTATSVDFRDMLSARINYRVRNTSSEPIKSLDVKCVWYSMNGEQLDQSTEYVVGYGDVPLGVGQFKTGFVRCGTGYRNARVPVKVDVYLESGDKRSLVYKGLLIQ